LGRFVSSEAGAASVLLALVFLVRIVAAATTPLTEDEAYYRLWSQHLAFGYYDHPPMIAWWIRLGITVAGDGPFGVRALPVLASAVTSLLVFDLTRRLGGSQRTAWRATLWYNATLTVGLGAMLAAPDAPASLFWVLTLCCLARARNDDRWWLAVGAAAGLGILSKYSALFLGPGILLWLLCDKSRSASLARPWVWLGGVTAGLIALPNLIWNAQHHWATVAKQFGRMAPVGFAPLHLPQFLIFQTLLFGPVLLLFVWRALCSHGAATRAATTLVAATSAPFLGYLVLHSLHGQVEEHWPVPLFAGGAVLAALGADLRPMPPWGQRLSRLGIAAPTLILAYLAAPAGGPKPQPPRVWLTWLPLLGLVAPVLLIAYLALPTAPLKRDPALPVRGWADFSQRLSAIRARAGATWIGTVSYGGLAKLTEHGGDPTPVLQIDQRVRYLGWPPPRGFDQNTPGIIVDLSRRYDRTLLLRCFAEVDPLGELDRGAPGGAQAHYSLYRVRLPKLDLLKTGCPSRQDID
jgi:4-amino-4-deoxy-L-arabinose transferase-like glycosyltransferase